MGVTSRMYVASVELLPNDCAAVTLRVVCRGPENRTWAKWSPSGEYKKTVTNPAATQWYIERIGKELRVDESDRDPICDRCHQEVPPSVESSSTFDENGAAVFVHKQDCSPQS